jgi:hypothetical protein
LCAVRWKRAGERSSRPRSKPAVAMATFQPCPSSPMRLSARHAHVVEEHLGKGLLAVQLP